MAALGSPERGEAEEEEEGEPRAGSSGEPAGEAPTEQPLTPAQQQQEKYPFPDHVASSESPPRGVPRPPGGRRPHSEAG
ncbi:hypothetical protein R3I94_004977 [Phoxinus phoxinus]